MDRQRLFELYVQLFRRKLASVDALPQLALLGLVSGLLTALVIVLFRYAIEWPLAHFLPDHNAENFEGLSIVTRSILPLACAVLIGSIWYRLNISQRKVGVAFVMERLGYHQGYITLKSAMTQFIGGALALVSGQSGGREGPAVHLGAACSSLLGQYMRLPNNSIRTLVGCGTAAAISASFNTPIAGVIFAMEVVMMEYSIAGFTPIIVASVVAALVCQLVFGADLAFTVPSLHMQSLLEVPYIILMGLIIGGASAAFVYVLKFFLGFKNKSIFLRIVAAGVLTGLAAIAFPQIMGIGYDTVNAAIFGELGLLMLLAISVIKLLLTATSVGLGMPSGLVGPTLFIGATLGGALGMIGALLAPEDASSPGFYAMLGMGAMMGSTLQAPLAALMALLELTHNPNIILPGMLIIVVSSMVASEVFGQRSVFLTILKAQGLEYQNEPVIQALRRVGVGAIMERNFERVGKVISYNDAKELLKKEPRWILIDQEQVPIAVLPAVDLARHIEELEAEHKSTPEALQTLSVSLLAIPAQRKDVAPLYLQATLQEALDKFSEAKTEALYIERTVAPMIKPIMGIVTRADIDNYYQYKRR